MNTTIRNPISYYDNPNQNQLQEGRELNPIIRVAPNKTSYSPPLSLYTLSSIINYIKFGCNQVL